MAFILVYFEKIRLYPDSFRRLTDLQKAARYTADAYGIVNGELHSESTNEAA